MSKDKKENNDNKINIERKSKEPVANPEEINVKQREQEQKDIEGIDQNMKKKSVVTEEEYNTLKEKTEKLEKEVDSLKDRLLRKAAEFDNYKRRTENEQLNLFKYAAENFIIKILPVYDDMERSVNHIKEAENIEAIKEGLQLVLNKFQKILDEQGVKKIESVGKPFDVNYHEALLQRTVEGVDPHIVIDEVEAGYFYKDKVIRHAKVIVSDENSTVETNGGSDKNENS